MDYITWITNFVGNESDFTALLEQQKLNFDPRSSKVNMRRNADSFMLFL